LANNDSNSTSAGPWFNWDQPLSVLENDRGQSILFYGSHQVSWIQNVKFDHLWAPISQALSHRQPFDPARNLVSN